MNRSLRSFCESLFTNGTRGESMASQGLGKTSRRWSGAFALLMAISGTLILLAQEKTAKQEPPAASAEASKSAANQEAGPIVVQLVTDFESKTPVSELENFEAITETQFSTTGSREVTLGERCTLWVRNAHVDGKYFFERYYQDKFVGRRATLEIAAKDLTAGEHFIEPGHHRFVVEADGRLSSNDPDIQIDDRTVSLKLYKVDVLPVDAQRTGPPEFRLVPVPLSVLSTSADFKLDSKALPDLKSTFNPQKPPQAGKSVPQVTEMLSHSKTFLSLSVWLPANEVGQGYLLYPSWQTFKISSSGKIEAAKDAPHVPGLEFSSSSTGPNADATGALSIVIPYQPMRGKISSHTGLTAGVGAAKLDSKMNLGPTVEPFKFTAGHEKPDPSFFLAIDNDATKRPNKFFIADNTTGDKDAIRLVAVEWDSPVFARGSEVEVAVRLLETPEKQTLKQPEVRVSFSKYNPASPAAREWIPLHVSSWKNDPHDGLLRFQSPDIDFQFVMFRVQIFDRDDTSLTTPLTAEVSACVIERDQKGSASFITNRGRNAFVNGEEIALQLVFRSLEKRAAGKRSVVLVDPDGNEENLSVDDDGAPWQTVALRLFPEQTKSMPTGQYSITVRDLPAGMAAVPFKFDIVSTDRPTLFHIVKTSKYTDAMNGLEPSHTSATKTPIDLERAMDTLAHLGYSRVDLMTYQTNHHLRGYTWREGVVARDERLPPPEAVYAPTPREQMLNGCVRNQMQFADVLLSYNDFHLPRMIEPYVRASERWIAREVQAMRHSPAFDGMLLYDEMYQSAVTGIVEHHPKYFAAVRARLAEEKFGVPPAKISQAITRYVQRPPAQRDPQALQQFIAYQNWQQHSWADYANRLVAVGKQILPRARFGTYHRTWLSPGSNDDIYHGYTPDLFKNMDIISHVHYADNSTAWVNTPLVVNMLKTGNNKTLYVNMPLVHESRTNWDGQYTRQMAFAVMASGATGVAQWGLPHGFNDGPNSGTAIGYETTRQLNREILQPFGELIQRTGDGYLKVGVVSVMSQHAMSEFKQIGTSNQTEGIQVACWRLGYPAEYVREENLEGPLHDFSVLFVPGIRFEGELSEAVLKRLKEAIAAGVRVVVEADSTLDLPGITKLTDWQLNSYFLGDNYFATWADDELNKVYWSSQPIVDYLRPKFLEWNIEPAARGDFQVGPNWRDGGAIDYMIMANFDDPPYSHTVKQQMALPKVFLLQVPKSRGKVAYDLIQQQRLEIGPATDGRENEQTVALDLRRTQGTIVAFTPEPIAKLSVRHELRDNQLNLVAGLLDDAGREFKAVFPVKITVRYGSTAHTYHRVLGKNGNVSLTVPSGMKDREYSVEVREGLSGRTAKFNVRTAARKDKLLVAVPMDRADLPFKDEVQRFARQIEEGKRIAVVPSAAIAGSDAVAQELVAQLKAKKIDARVVAEGKAYRRPTGDRKSEDPLGDGFHSWRNGQEIIGPALVVDEAVIVLGGRRGSALIDALAEHGMLSFAPIGRPGLSTMPSVQLATKGLHFAHDALCLVANDATGLKVAANTFLDVLKTSAADQAPQKENAQVVEGPVKEETSDRGTAIVPAIAKLGTNELVENIQFDAAGNLYAITWGHGKNLYSIDPQGKMRFSRHLPEMGVNRLEVHADRLLAYTAAGARLYQLSLDNKPLSQARINRDPGGITGCDNYSLSHADYAWIPQKGWLLHNLGEQMRVMDEKYNIIAHWEGEMYFDKDVADRVLNRELHHYTLSPDGTRIAQFETSQYFTSKGYLDDAVYDVHLVIRDLQGKLLHEHKNIDNGTKVVARLSWPVGAPGPIILAPNSTVAEGHERWEFNEQAELLAKKPFNAGMISLGGEKRLVRNGRLLQFFNQVQSAAFVVGPFPVFPTFAAASHDDQHVATLDETGLLRIFAAKEGQQRASVQLPQVGKVVRFTPDGQGVVVGGYRGRVMRYNLDGKLAWERELAPENDSVGGYVPEIELQPDNAKPLQLLSAKTTVKLPLYDRSFPDFTEKIWPIQRDEPGQLEQLVRLGANRLLNGNAEQEGGWQGEQVSYRAPGYEGARSLVVGREMIGQEVTGYLGRHATWVVEFFYRAADEKTPVELLAGLMTESKHSDSTAGRFEADGTWRFGRVAIKNGVDCKKLMVGFSCSSGECLVDSVQFRQVRYPSVNHLLSEPLHDIQPVVLENPLFSQKYDPVGNLREQATNRVMIPTLPGPLNLVESAWMQNGRLNETSSHWYIQPYSRETNELIISLSLKEPRWVSTLALHFNQYNSENVTPHFDIFAVDPETGRDKLMASVRHNAQVYRVVKFPPIKTTLVKLIMMYSIERHRTLSEIELYGPLSGREGVPGFIDADGQNTYMGDFTRVDKRLKTLADDYSPPVTKRGSHDEENQWAAPLAQPLVSEGRFYLARTFGRNSAHALSEPAKELSWARAGSLGYTPYGALYGGLLLRCGNDGKLYCLNPETGTELWSVSLGKRLFGCPVAIGEDVFVASDQQKLYQVDLASGTIMKETSLSGVVFGSLTTDDKSLFFITDDGHLNAYDPVTFQMRWQIPIAPSTDSTPAVDGGIVYLADQQGKALAVDATSGKVRWSTDLKDEFARCPVVGPKHVIYGCRDGSLAVLNRGDGKVLWSKKVKSRFEYEPLLANTAEGEQLLFFIGGTATLAKLSDGTETSWQTSATSRGKSSVLVPPLTLNSDPVVPLSYYRGHLFFIERPSDTGHNHFQINMPWHVVGGSYTVLVPAPVAEGVKK